MHKLSATIQCPGDCMQLPATALHDVSSASIILQNTTAEAQTFEFSLPKGSDLTLSPHVATIEAEGSMNILLRYCPQPSTLPPAPEGSLGTAPSSAAADNAVASASRGFEEEGVDDVSVCSCNEPIDLSCIGDQTVMSITQYVLTENCD